MQRSSTGNLALSSLLLILLLLAPFAALRPEAASACRDLIHKDVAASQAPPARGYVAVSACLPWRGDLWEEAGRAALQAGDAETAVRYLETARQHAARLGRPPERALSPQGLSDLAAAYQELGNYPAALEIRLSIAALNGLDAAQADGIARLYLAQGDFAGAAAIWQKLSAQQPDDAQALYQSSLLLATQQPEAALQPLEKAALLDPSLEKDVSTLRQAIMGARLGDDPAYSLLAAGRVLAVIGRWDLAAEAFRQAVLKQPGYAEAWAYLGEARQHLPAPAGSISEAAASGSDGLSELQTALELDPKSLSAQTFLALYRMRRGEYDQALEAMRQALALSPDNPALTAELAGVQAASGDLYGAYETYQKAAALSPYDPEYRRRIIRFSLAYNFQVDQIALALARQLLAVDQPDPIDLDLMAQVLISRGDLLNAERFLARSLQASPRYAPARLHLGLVYLLQGDARAAGEQFELASALDPGGPSDFQARRLMEHHTP